MMRYEKDGILIGVLNDYDLSSLASAQGRQGNERTGTVPFMALDLLTPEGQGGEINLSSICIVMISSRLYGFLSGFVFVTRTEDS